MPHFYFFFPLGDFLTVISASMFQINYRIIRTEDPLKQEYSTRNSPLVTSLVAKVALGNFVELLGLAKHSGNKTKRH